MSYKYTSVKLVIELLYPLEAYAHKRECDVDFETILLSLDFAFFLLLGGS